MIVSPGVYKRTRLYCQEASLQHIIAQDAKGKLVGLHGEGVTEENSRVYLLVSNQWDFETRVEWYGDG